MSITKSEAILKLAIWVGRADGTFSEDEWKTARHKMPLFNEVVTDARATDWTAKEKAGELTQETSLKLLEASSTEDKLEAMAICWGMMLANDAIEGREDELMNKWIERLGLTKSLVTEKYAQLIQE